MTQDSDTLSTAALDYSVLCDLVECLVCKEIVTKTPLYQCEAVCHTSIICQDCNSKLKVCPICKMTIGKRLRNRFAESLIDKLSKNCQFIERGCHHQLFGPENLINHINECNFRDFACPNKSCPIKIMKKDVEIHRISCEYKIVNCTNSHLGCKNSDCRFKIERHQKHCQFNLTKCDGCTKKFTQIELKRHKRQCPFKIVKCPNFPCKVTCKKLFMDSHKNACDFEIIPCTNVMNGCLIKLTRKKLSHHLKKCQFKRVNCINKNYGCQETYYPKNEKYHKCEFISCPFLIFGCQYKGPFKTFHKSK